MITWSTRVIRLYIFVLAVSVCLRLILQAAVALTIGGFKCYVAYLKSF